MYYTNYWDSDHNLVNQKQYFFPRNGTVLGGLFYMDYGHYYGASFLKKIDGNGRLVSNFDFAPVDYVDKIAMIHDMMYKATGNENPKGELMNGWQTTPADIFAYENWSEFYDNYNTGDIDPTGIRITRMEMRAAWNGKTLFGILSSMKQRQIAYWMKDNYFDMDGVETNALRENFITQNYNLFIDMYMHKNEDGYYVKNAGMWELNDENIFVPIQQNGGTQATDR